MCLCMLPNILFQHFLLKPLCDAPANGKTRCVIWYLLYNLKNVENTHGGVLL